jgi:glycosyltransferase involved in cell wall biosynthesis
MTVAIFHPAFHAVGGAEILVASYARSLRKLGLDVRVVTLSIDAPRWKTWLEDVPVQVVPKPRWTDSLASRVTQLERTAVRAETCLRDFHTVLAFNFPTNALLGATSISSRRFWYCTEPSRHLHMVQTNPRLYERVTLSPGGITEAEKGFAKLISWHMRATGKPSARAREIEFDIANTRKLETIISISEFGRENVRRVYDRADTEVIYPIVRFPPSRTTFRSGLRRTGLNVLTHSRLEVPKNVDGVVRGFALLLSKVPGSELHVLGDGKERPRLQKLVEALGIGRSVRFHGYVPESELERIYDLCDVFALTTLDEPFGMVYPEAAARGLLLVGPDHGGPFEILDGGRLGWVCDPFEPEALLDALLQIWSLSDAEVNARRIEADTACRNRYSESVIGPRLLRALTSSSSAAAG